MRKPARLPAEFQEVQYIEGTGTQYINTGIVLRNEKEIYIAVDFMVLDNATGDNCIMGATASNRGPYGGMKFPNWCNNNVEVRGYGINNNCAGTVNRSTMAKMVFDYKDGSQIVSLNNEIIISSSNGWAKGSGDPLYIFGTSNAENPCWLAIARIYDVIIRLRDATYDFVPCYRKSDDKPGMYDLASGTFFTNQGTGEFLYGANVN